uniref:Uncharacterized protein n=1 Tax=Opuntia streptacantha TaxID=393608 RepID=A0A7C9EEQ6_OPUST
MNCVGWSFAYIPRLSFSNLRSEIVRGSLILPYSAPGILRKMQNKPIEKTKKTETAAMSSERVNGNLPSHLAFFPVGESASFASALSISTNLTSSPTTILGATIAVLP